MFHFATNTFRLWATCIAMSTFSIFGCSGESDDASPRAEVAAPVVDDRFVSVDSLLAEFNRITTRDPVDLKATYALFYAENPKQRALLDMTIMSFPVFELQAAMEKRFQQPIEPKDPGAFVNKPNGPATMTKNLGERAEATYKEHDGKQRTLEMVRIGGRWWISGYTIEHLPEMRSATDDDLLFARITLRTLASASPGLVSRINAGEFKSADDVRKAIEIASARVIMQNPIDQQAIRDLAARNPKYAAMFKAAALPPQGK